MWKCSECGTENEFNFCTNCRCSKEESELKQITPEQPDHQQPISEQPTMEQPDHQQPISEQPTTEQTDHQQLMPETQSISSEEGEEPVEKSSNKGIIIAFVLIIGVVALFVSVIVFAVRLIMNNNENDTRDTDVYVEEEYDEEDNGEVDDIFERSPFNVNVWGATQVAQIDNDNITLEVPLPPDTILEDVEIDGSALFIQQGSGEEYFLVRVFLNSEREEDFEEYSEYEINNALEWHNDTDVIDYSIHNVANATLLIVQWEDDIGTGVTFVKIREYKGFFLVTDISFESLENRRDFFEAYGFNDYFESIIRDTYDDLTSTTEDMPNQDEEEEEDNRSGEVVWTPEQSDSWWDLSDEFWEVSEATIDLYFYIWDSVILDDTVHDDYPNADVDRLVELHTEFDERFEEMLGLNIEIDFSLPYDSEHNQNAFQEKRDLISEHERYYSYFRAALEGR